jgi:hypothetical protein
LGPIEHYQRTSGAEAVSGTRIVLLSFVAQFRYPTSNTLYLEVKGLVVKRVAVSFASGFYELDVRAVLPSKLNVKNSKKSGKARFLEL